MTEARGAVPRRGPSVVGQLARLGFAEADSAAELLSGPALRNLATPEVVSALAAAADPDAAVAGLHRLAVALPDSTALAEALRERPEVRDGLAAVLGTSRALAGHLERHPRDWTKVRGITDVRPTAAALRGELLMAVGADPVATAPVAADSDTALDALRVAYRARLLTVAARDLGAGADVGDVAAELADLAAAALEAALAIARRSLLDRGGDPESCRLAVVAMGKCGGRELNYASDVDVVFVAEPVADVEPGTPDEQRALRTAADLAVGLMRACSAPTREGSLWPVDAALRPEGKAGPLVRTLGSHRAYYEKWARTWEFQALLKARPVAGDIDLGRSYVDTVAPMVWEAAGRPGFVEDVQQMRRRVESTVPTERELKLGPGGLRDVEFAVQLLQLVHGRSDELLRSSNTLAALAALAEHGYVGRDDAPQLDEAYRFLRRTEHRLQLRDLRRTHRLPSDPQDLRWLGRSLGLRADPVRDLEDAWRRHAREVRRLHEKLFYRPLLTAVARLGSRDARLTPEAAGKRLEALGYRDPAGALRHLEALTEGVSRRAAIQRTLLPVLLGYFADAPDPDGGLLAFRRLSEAMGGTHWYLRLLRDEGAVAERLAWLLASSRFAVDLLGRIPEAIRLLADDADLAPRTRAQLASELAVATARHEDPAAAVGVARSIRRRELFRIAAADLLGLVGIEEVGEALTELAAATLQAALDVACRRSVQQHGGVLPTRIAVIAMGRFGGGELSYGSDVDVLFVHDPLPGVPEQVASEAAHAVVTELRSLLSVPSPDPPLVVDADLRPEGRQGPLVRSLASYAAYYERWSLVWESQALLRAVPVAGDAELAARFVALVDPHRYPSGGLSDAEVREIRRIKARVESERLPRGADPSRHTKLGPGGLADVEWTVQLLQLQHAATVPELRTARTLEALAAAVAAGLLDERAGEVLSTAWRLGSRVRNGVLLALGRPGDSIPTNLAELAGVARVLGYPAGESGVLVDEYRRAARRARTVVDGVFYA